MSSNTNANPFTRFDDLMAECGFIGFDARLAAYSFIDKFRWFHRSEHDCPKAMWMSGWKQSGRYGIFALGQKFNMTTVYNWCLDNDESVYTLLNWLDRASAAMDECLTVCSAAYWRDRLGDDAFDSDRGNSQFFRLTFLRNVSQSAVPLERSARKKVEKIPKN